MRCTEGVTLTEEQQRAFDLELFADGEMSIGVLENDCGDLGDDYYNAGGEGVLTVNLRDVLDEYLSGEYEYRDGPEGIDRMADLLREMDRITNRDTPLP